MPDQRRYFHLHLISDSTGETLIAASRAVAAQYEHAHAIEHVHPMVRNRQKLDEIIAELDDKPGIVLFTIANEALAFELIARCQQMGIPCVSVLEPIFQTFQSYLGMPGTRKSGAQHELNAEYFHRIDAINFTLMHDDGAHPENAEEADVVLLGISRTSKTPTSIYLANRGLKIANIPLVPDVPLPRSIEMARRPLVVALVASTDRIFQVRQHRFLGEIQNTARPAYTDRAAIAAELTATRKLCKQHGWPMIDVTRRSIEETAAQIHELWQEHCERSDIDHTGSQPA